MATFEDIARANATIKTTKVQNKDYAEVNQRIKAFRMVYPEGQIYTQMLSCENGVCVFKAEVSVNGVLIGTGHAYEKEGSSFINKTSYIENCETSACGRALGMAGFGIDTSVASAEEVQNAILNQEKKTNAREQSKLEALQALIVQVGSNSEEICKYYEVASLSDLSEEQWAHATKILNARKERNNAAGAGK